MVERYTPDQLTPELVDGWRELVAELGERGSWFLTPDWVLSWWETLGGRGPAEIVVWRGEGGAVQAVLPLVRTRLRLHPRLPFTVGCRTPLGAGPGAADHGGFAVAPGRAAEVRAWLTELAGRETLWFPDVDPLLGELLPAARREVSRQSCPRADLTGGAEALGSRQFRADLRRYGRKLAAAGVTFRWVPPGEAPPGLLDTVVRLHRLRRNALGRGTTFDHRRLPLHTRLLERARPGAGPAFLLAEHEGEVVGGLYGFLWGDTFAYYQIGWDPAWAPLRLGTAIIAEAVRACAERKLTTFDFLRGTEPYKYRFDAADRADLSWLVPHGLSGALLGLKHRLKG
ncbi:GNAT family N-acetyltransferase [Kitasatospora sp. NPDC101801]|uniref:GNAT family N-acetyltransferase n=1 Tax=Kitasatospora sp. NPDC101801 TaxID=3364103 RepID=UPI00381BB4DA